MNLEAFLPDKAQKAHIAKKHPGPGQGIGQHDRYPVRDLAAQNNQKKGDCLQGKIKNKKTRTGKTLAVLLPQKNDDHQTDNIGEYITENNCAHIQHKNPYS